MRTFARLVLGVLCAICVVWLSALAYSQLIEHLPVPRGWWMAHPAILYAVEVLTFVPFAVVLAILFSRLFLRHAIASAFACTLVAMAVVFVPTAIRSYDLLWPVLRVNAEFILTFLIGVPIAVIVLHRRQPATSSPA
jgi:hypothetical protein